MVMYRCGDHKIRLLKNIFLKNILLIMKIQPTTLSKIAEKAVCMSVFLTI